MLDLPGRGDMPEHLHWNYETQGKTPTFFSVGHSKQAMPRLAFHIPATVEIPTFLSVGGSPIVVGGRTPENREETIRWLAAIGSCKLGLINA